MDFGVEYNDLKRYEEFPMHLNMSNKKLETIPQDIYTMYPFVQYLYLENNKITEIPEDFFTTLRNLIWLDLRDNLITAIPSTIGTHENLQTLLLKNNKIEVLPLELGEVASLRGLQLQGNPLRSPPPAVVEEGVAAVLRWLREEAHARAARGAVVALPPPPPLAVAAPAPAQTAPDASASSERPRARTAVSGRKGARRAVEKEEAAERKAEGCRPRPAPSAPPRERRVALMPSPPLHHQVETRSGSGSDGFDLTSVGSVDGVSLAAAAAGNHSVASLGSRKKTQIIKQMLREMWLAKISEKLLERDKELEKKMSQDVLKTWRKNWKRPATKLVTNYKLKAPFDLHYSDDKDGLSTRTPKQRLLVEDLATLEQILTANMAALETTDPEEARSALARRMHNLTDLQKRLQAIRFKAMEDKTYYKIAPSSMDLRSRSNLLDLRSKSNLLDLRSKSNLLET